METVDSEKKAIFKETVLCAASQVSNFYEECTTASFKLCTQTL
jgi:hypothetical protein